MLVLSALTFYSLRRT